MRRALLLFVVSVTLLVAAAVYYLRSGLAPPLDSPRALLPQATSFYLELPPLAKISPKARLHLARLGGTVARLLDLAPADGVDPNRPAGFALVEAGDAVAHVWFIPAMHTDRLATALPAWAPPRFVRGYAVFSENRAARDAAAARGERPDLPPIEPADYFPQRLRFRGASGRFWLLRPSALRAAGSRFPGGVPPFFAIVAARPGDGLARAFARLGPLRGAILVLDEAFLAAADAPHETSVLKDAFYGWNRASLPMEEALPAGRTVEASFRNGDELATWKAWAGEVFASLPWLDPAPDELAASLDLAKAEEISTVERSLPNGGTTRFVFLRLPDAEAAVLGEKAKRRLPPSVWMPRDPFAYEGYLVQPFEGRLAGRPRRDGAYLSLVPLERGALLVLETTGGEASVRRSLDLVLGLDGAPRLADDPRYARLREALPKRFAAFVASFDESETWAARALAVAAADERHPFPRMYFAEIF